MVLRKIVHIDEDKCNGCGKCIPECHEGALQIVDGRARLVSERYCDGLGDCLGACPQDAIRIEEREVDDYDEEAVWERKKRANAEQQPGADTGGCPGASLMMSSGAGHSNVSGGDKNGSALTQWPVQLHLVPPNAPFLNGADLLITADCVPFACATFHSELLAGRKLLVGCPKLDDSEAYLGKLISIFRGDTINSVTVVHMEVPCCKALQIMVNRALEEAGAEVPLETVEIAVSGKIKERTNVSV